MSESEQEAMERIRVALASARSMLDEIAVRTTENARALDELQGKPRERHLHAVPDDEN
jgi:hypothetical protein